MTRTPPAIIDTNVVVAGLLTSRTDSPVVRILDGIVAASFPFVLSEALLAEYRKVLVRPKLRRLHALDDNEIDNVLLELAQHAIVLEPASTRPDAPDSGDQHLWDLLRTREDLVLVTGDLRLYRSSDMRERILLPSGFVGSMPRS